MFTIYGETMVYWLILLQYCYFVYSNDNNQINSFILNQKFIQKKKKGYVTIITQNQLFYFLDNSFSRINHKEYVAYIPL